MLRQFCFLVLLLTIFFVACTREQLLSGSTARLGASTDSLFFDTLFTKALSTTQSFRIYNQNNQKIKISTIRLAGGTGSAFRININGEPGPQAHDIEIAANDSIHVFVNTQVPAGNNDYPFIVEDSILIDWNNNSSVVKLSAWGQNARYIKNGIITSNTQWDNELPYVVLGELQVAENAILRITKGARIYCHANAPVYIDGTLQVNGDTAYKDRVIFTNDRLDAPYRNFPASWPGLYFRQTSHDNSLAYTIIKNAYQGIITTGLPEQGHSKLLLEQCILDNIWDAGFMAINSAAVLNNCLLSNCGKNVQLLNGGHYNFNQCTVASYSTIYSTHKEPVVFISDGITINNMEQTAPLDAVFTNCILWGSSDLVGNEVVCSKQGQHPYSIVFNDGLWRMKEIPTLITANNMLNDIDPGFEKVTGDPADFNFRLNPGSPALDKGQYTQLSIDLDGKPRNFGIPDLGAYEKQ